ncbi:MAG: hypothetical protein LBF28_03575 [Rickettsiales bacterium]|nr:hypothetical protein [Rickettsiales bacterium]
MKPRYKRRIFWGVIFATTGGTLALAVAPAFVNLNHLKPKIETAIYEQTGLAAKIDGNINFSLLGGATIVVHNVMLDKGAIDHVLFSIPLAHIFDLKSATLTNDIFVYNARLDVDELTPPKFDNAIYFQDSIISFKGKDYEIIRGTLSGGLLRGVVRTDQNEYEFDSDGDKFHITNDRNNLDISGRLHSNGSANGTLSIDTDNINEWFEFKEPMISRRIKMTMNFDWNGNYGFKFSNIRGDDFSGQIELLDDGSRSISLYAANIDFDLSFLMGTTGIFYKTSFNLDLHGNLKFADKHFGHVKIDAAGTKSKIIIKEISADDIIISGGIITTNGAENIPIRMQFYNEPTYCLFSGSPESWKCSDFKYGDLSGSLSVSNGTFNIFIQSDKKMPDRPCFAKKTSLLGDRGRINFQFADIGGTIAIDKQKETPSYSFAKNKALDWLEIDLGFMPDSMRSTIGDYVWHEDRLSFTPHSNRWKLSITKDFFQISGRNFKDWLPNAELRFLNDLEYTISGNYNKGGISNLEIKIAGHTFFGSAIGNSITLRTNLLNIDTFANQNFVDEYDELQFLAADPLMVPHSLSINISLSADTVIYNGNDFKNFVYALRDGTQSFSITDTRRGNLLANIAYEYGKYSILLQMNKFAASGKLLSALMSLNIADAMVTGQATFNTFGKIAYDFWYNLAGRLDMSFDGGYIQGLGIDGFYANSQNITTINGELILAGALDGGATALKSLHIVGDYDGGNFVTTAPFSLSMKHTDATGHLSIINGQMSIDMNLVLRGTSTMPAPISIKISPDGKRSYSLSQIMTNFDPDFFRDFVATHDKF